MNAAVTWFKDIDKWSIPKILRLTSTVPDGWSLEKIGNLVTQVTEKVRVERDKEYGLIGVKWYNEGTFHRETVEGNAISAAHLTPVVPGAFIYNGLFAWKQSFAVVPSEHEGYFVSNEFPQFVVDRSRLLPEYLYLIFRLQKTINLVLSTSVGSAAVSRNRFKEEEFLKFEIPIPPMDIQHTIVSHWQRAQKTARYIEEQMTELENKAKLILFLDLGINFQSEVTKQKVFTTHFKYLTHWNVRANQVALQEHVCYKVIFLSYRAETY